MRYHCLYCSHLLPGQITSLLPEPAKSQHKSIKLAQTSSSYALANLTEIWLCAYTWSKASLENPSCAEDLLLRVEVSPYMMPHHALWCHWAVAFWEGWHWWCSGQGGQQLSHQPLLVLASQSSWYNGGLSAVSGELHPTVVEMVTKSLGRNLDLFQPPYSRTVDLLPGTSFGNSLVSSAGAETAGIWALEARSRTAQGKVEDSDGQYCSNTGKKIQLWLHTLIKSGIFWWHIH